MHNRVHSSWQPPQSSLNRPQCVNRSHQMKFVPCHTILQETSDIPTKPFLEGLVSPQNMNRLVRAVLDHECQRYCRQTGLVEQVESSVHANIHRHTHTHTMDWPGVAVLLGSFCASRCLSHRSCQYITSPTWFSLNFIKTNPRATSIGN